MFLPGEDCTYNMCINGTPVKYFNQLFYLIVIKTEILYELEINYMWYTRLIYTFLLGS